MEMATGNVNSNNTRMFGIRKPRLSPEENRQAAGFMHLRELRFGRKESGQSQGVFASVPGV